MNEYLGIDSDGYMCANCLRAVIAKWLNGSQKTPDDV